jgi:hypothetical protein
MRICLFLLHSTFKYSSNAQIWNILYRACSDASSFQGILERDGDNSGEMSNRNYWRQSLLLESVLCVNIDVRWLWVVSATPRPLYPRERPGTHCIGGWVGPRAGLNWCGKSHFYRNSIPGPPQLSRYTDWAIAAHSTDLLIFINLNGGHPDVPTEVTKQNIILPV